MNGWICSIIFHTRDFPLTELLDYGFAYSMVLANFCCMILRWVQLKNTNSSRKIKINYFHRMVHWSSSWVKSSISLVSAMFFINHFVYLSIGRFDYQYNMKTNILTGMSMEE